ncbi:hypothetical protein LWI29_013371 [Acer saccharum]|uniref:Uncharacterized protein n=1 Tax=Acer saccharum TaxID=4024 RepID=A0AA39W5E0_ACESA|nr:hypothetical protein LWI29_013371 [Acer saccharum]
MVLTVVGKLLCGEPAAVWQSKVKEWDKGESNFISGTELLVCLQSSLNALDDEVKECYLDLGSFPRNQRILMNALIDMWIELHNWVEDGLSAITYLHKFSDRNLINLIITRYAAFKNSNFQISDAFPNLLEFEIDYCNDLEELPVGLCDIVSLKKLSITNCHKLSTLPEGIGKLVNLEELRLACCSGLSELPEMVTELSKLKLLDISDCTNLFHSLHQTVSGHHSNTHISHTYQTND